ncbi:Aste57867_7119 [Aphanomyces stellatus]|uniref:Aste57867_6911 protein n=1 Tax=Aphanomyces stellatus TaxID=120398 RepID=A0A485KFH7_9STRA|nr:hypothetical protein As57867_007095 [Aphanomyces stellatus]KAF0705827.1 hypothetical protein As57867_006889 [Aphanomyces stellatus]VFT83863.1 Aste57867_6911 [Aphanomyces stellatus]VFT84051.1 Aste57867_7119 [Aphanomyces stellatus]
MHHVGSPSSSSSTASPPPPTSSLAKRRLRGRQKMQRYRQRLLSEVAVLKDEIRALETQSRELTRPRLLLPWETVADVLREERAESALTNTQLRVQVDHQASLIRAMKERLATKLEPRDDSPPREKKGRFEEAGCDDIARGNQNDSNASRSPGHIKREWSQSE